MSHVVELTVAKTPEAQPQSLIVSEILGDETEKAAIAHQLSQFIQSAPLQPEANSLIIEQDNRFAPSHLILLAILLLVTLMGIAIFCAVWQCKDFTFDRDRGAFHYRCIHPLWREQQALMIHEITGVEIKAMASEGPADQADRYILTLLPLSLKIPPLMAGEDFETIAAIEAKIQSFLQER